MDGDLERLVRGYALKNAVKHGGKASLTSVMSMIMADHPELRGEARRIASIARLIVEEVNKMDPASQRRMLEEEYPELAREEAAKEEEKRGLPPLPNAVTGKVRVRFAPNPDFVIHIGNARPAIINSEYAKMYKGVMILRFEDTDPRTKAPLREAYDLIREDLRWLGVEWHEEYIQSLRLDVYYSVARRLIERGCAYIDLCGEEGKELLSKGSYCHTRDRAIEWHLEQLDRMLEGHYGEGEAVYRIKTDPKHPNPSVRDWVAMRIIDTTRHPHPLVGDKYVVWPTYNFAVSVDDHLMGITHVLRGKEHLVNTEKQLFVYRCMGWDPPVFIHLGRLKLEGFILSKSKIRELLEREPGRFLGYDDPRFGTIAGLRRRGILPEAVREVILSVGVKEGDATISWPNLASVNRKILDERADRIMFVSSPVRARITLSGGGCRKASIPYHPNRPERSREIEVCDGGYVLVQEEDLREDEVRLMGLSNFRIQRSTDSPVELVEVDPRLEYARSRKLQIVQWVPESGKVEVVVYEPDGLDLKKYRGYAEQALKHYKEGDVLQFVRFGFVKIDEAGERPVLFLTHR